MLFLKYRIPIFFIFLVLLFAFTCKTVTHLAYTEPQGYKMDAAFQNEADPDILQMVAPYKKELEAEMNEVLAFCANDLYKKLPEGKLGNWLADILCIEGKKHFGDAIDFGVYNYGGIRLPVLSAGPITKGKLFELMPFENFMVVVDADYETTMMLLHRMAQSGGWPISQSLQFEIQDTLAVNVLLNKKPLDKNRNYKIAVSDYIANGGDQCFFLKNRPREDRGILVRDLILNHAVGLNAQGKKIDAAIEGRVKIRD